MVLNFWHQPTCLAITVNSNQLYKHGVLLAEKKSNEATCYNLAHVSTEFEDKKIPIHICHGYDL